MDNLQMKMIQISQFGWHYIALTGDTSVQCTVYTPVSVFFCISYGVW